LFFVDLCIDDHGSFVIFRSASVRPKHLFDPYFDHDYLFELPFSGSGMPNQVHDVLLHAMSDTELSHVRTELERRRILTSIPPHPVQANPQLPPHRYLGNAFVSTHRQVHVPTSPLRIASCCRLGGLHQQEALQRIALLMCPSRCLRALESSLGIIPTYVPICLQQWNRFGVPMINT
jgi:hypothetical protein